MSPQSFMESRNGKQFSNGSEPTGKNTDVPSSSIKSEKESIQTQNQKYQRQFAAGGDLTDSHRTGNAGDRDNALLNDLSQANINHHDKSFNEQLDDRSKFVLNQEGAVNSSIGSQHHNFSIGTIG